MTKLNYYMITLKSIYMDFKTATNYANALNAYLKRILAQKQLKAWICIGIADVCAASGKYGTTKTGKKGRPKVDYLGDYGKDWRVPHLHILIITDDIDSVKNTLHLHALNRFGDEVTIDKTNESDNWIKILNYVKKQCPKKRYLLSNEADEQFLAKANFAAKYLKDMSSDSHERR